MVCDYSKNDVPKRPEKKKETKRTDPENDFRWGYNQACEEWGEYHVSCIPSEDEIAEMVNVWFREYWEKPNGVIKEIAKAISKRLRGEK